MITILTLEEYKQDWLVPTSGDVIIQDSQLSKLIVDATNQIDNLCGGRVFKEFPTLIDETKIYKLKRAIGDLTLLLDQTGKMFYDSKSNGGGNAPFSISTQSDNSQVEWKRQDIIRNLIEAGFYQNVRINDSDIANIDTTTSNEVDALVKLLSQYFLRINGSNNYQSDLLNFPITTTLNNTGDIKGSDVVDQNTQQLRKPLITGYSFNIDTVLESQRTQTIFDPTTNSYKTINSFNIDYWNGLTKEEIYFAINASGSVWSATNVYRANFVVIWVDDNNEMNWYRSRLDNNIGNLPSDNNWWELLPNAAIDLNVILDQVKAYFDPKFVEEISNITNVIVPNEVTKQVNALITTNQIIIFKKGQVGAFNTIQDFEYWNQEFSLVKDVDYVELDTTNNLIGYGVDGAQIGSNIIKQSDLPNINLMDFMIQRNFWSDRVLGESNNTIPAGGPIAMMSLQTRNAMYLNGNVSQTQLNPLRRNVYFVVFLKDVLKNVVFAGTKQDVSYNGIAPIIVDNTNKTISLDDTYTNKWNGYEGTITTISENVNENTTNITNNKTLLDNVNTQVDTNTQAIVLHTSKIDTNTINITTNANDIATIKSEQTIQDNKITTNSTNITNIVEGLRTSTLVNYKGEWAQGNVAKLGEIWSYQTKLYLCKVATTTNLPTNETDFDLISSFEVNLDNYYTKLEIDNLLANYITTTSINTYLSNYYTKQEIDTKFTNYYTIPDLNRQMGEVIDLVNIKLNSAWNPLTNLVYQGPYLDIRFNAPINATEFAFSGRFRDANGYYACGGTFMNTSETIYIPTYKNGANEIYVSQLQTNGNQKILRVFNPVGNPVNGPAIADTFKVFWR